MASTPQSDADCGVAGATEPGERSACGLAGATEPGERSGAYRVKLYRLSGEEYMPVGLTSVDARTLVSTILEVVHWHQGPPTAIVANGVILWPDVPIGLFSSEIPIYVLLPGDTNVLESDAITRPCANLEEVQTPPTPSPR